MEIFLNRIIETLENLKKFFLTAEMLPRNANVRYAKYGALATRWRGWTRFLVRLLVRNWSYVVHANNEVPISSWGIDNIWTPGHTTTNLARVLEDYL